MKSEGWCPNRLRPVGQASYGMQGGMPNTVGWAKKCLSSQSSYCEEVLYSVSQTVASQACRNYSFRCEELQLCAGHKKSWRFSPPQARVVVVFFPIHFSALMISPLVYYLLICFALGVFANDDSHKIIMYLVP